MGTEREHPRDQGHVVRDLQLDLDGTVRVGRGETGFSEFLYDSAPFECVDQHSHGVGGVVPGLPRFIRESGFGVEVGWKVGRVWGAGVGRAVDPVDPERPWCRTVVVEADQIPATLTEPQECRVYGPPLAAVVELQFRPRPDR